MLAQHHIQDKVDAADGCRFLNIHADRVRLEPAGSGLIAHHHRVVRLNGRSGRAAGHDGLGAARVTGKVVELHVAEADAPVGFSDYARDIHRSPHSRGAHVHAVGRVAVDAADLIPGALTGQAAALLIGLLPVAAEGKHQGDVLFGHAGGVQLIQQSGHDLRRGHGARQVAGDDGDLLAWMHDLTEARGADRLAQGTAHFGVFRFNDRCCIRMQHTHQVFVRNLNDLR